MQLLRKPLQTASKKMIAPRKVSMHPARTAPVTSTMVLGMTRTGIQTGTSTGHRIQTDIQTGIAAGRAAEIGTRTGAEVIHSNAGTAGKAQERPEPAEVKMNGK